MSKAVQTQQGKKMPYLPIFVYGRGMPGHNDYSEFFDLKDDTQKATIATLRKHSLYVVNTKNNKKSDEAPVLVSDNNPNNPVQGELVYLEAEHYVSTLEAMDKHYRHVYLPHCDVVNGSIVQKRVTVTVEDGNANEVTAWAYEVRDTSSVALLESEALVIEDNSWESYSLIQMDAEFEADFAAWREDALMSEVEDAKDAFDGDLFTDSRYDVFSNSTGYPSEKKTYSSVQPSSKGFTGSKNRFYMEEATDKSQFIWYVAYGSNLNIDRFLKYMNAGRYTDKTKFVAEDLESVQIQIPNGVYFAKSGRWGDSGIAFLDVDTKEESTGAVRAYRLTAQQFWSLVCQENGSKSMTIPWADLDYQSTANCKETGLYSRIANFGTIEGEPVLTCTNKESYDSQLSKLEHELPWQYAQMGMLNPPSHEYLNIINEGARQTAELEVAEVEPFVAKKRPKAAKSNTNTTKKVSASSTK